MIVTLWKCRLCNVVVEGDAIHITEARELNERISSPAKAARISTHLCKTGALGVTDLAGAFERKEQP